MSDVDVVEALRVIRQEIDSTADPTEMASALALIGGFVLSRLGFVPDERAEVKIDIGTNKDDVMSIMLVWPLPRALPSPGDDGVQDVRGEAGEADSNKPDHGHPASHERDKRGDGEQDPALQTHGYGAIAEV